MRASFALVVVLFLGCGSTGGTGGGAGGSGGGTAGGAGGGSAGGVGGGTAGGAGGGAAGGSGGGTAGGSGGGSSDAGMDAGVPLEVEPNGGATAAELDTITLPGAKRGAVGAANDVDVFTVMLTAGQQVRWTLDAQSSALAPHLSITGAQNTVPILVSRAAAGGSAVIDQLVLKTATYAIIARDSRNVPSSTTQNVGSALHSYVLSATAMARTPVQVTVPSTTSGALDTRYSGLLHRFTLASPTAVTVNVLAKNKSPASDLDSRLTLFNATTNQSFGTNDDVSLSNTDSKLTGTLAAGDYFALVENVSETANDLSFQLVITSP